MVKYFDRVLLNDASHFQKGGNPINFDSPQANNNEIIEKEGDLKDNELKVIAPCRKNIINFPFS